MEEIIRTTVEKERESQSNRKQTCKSSDQTENRLNLR